MSDAEGPVPRFARDFPQDPGLDALVRDFASGNYARVRAQAPELARSSERDDVKRAAEELVRRTRPDPLMIALLAFAGVLLAFLACYWVMRRGGNG